MAAEILDGKGLAQRLQAELAEDVARFTAASGVTPQLAAVLVGEDAASEVYIRNKRRGCERVGMNSSLNRLPAATTQSELLDVVRGLNKDAAVHGILVQLPLPPHIAAAAILDAVAPHKDVDCFHPENVGLLVQGRPRFKPCTPHGVQRLLTANFVETAGKHAVVLGRSEIVGKPLAALLMQRGPGGDATVTVCHSRTPNLGEIARQADILVAAIGRPQFVTAEMVKPGAVVVDVGINRTDVGIVGDVDFAEVRRIAAKISPVPGGVGPLTVTMLLFNTLAAAQFATGICRA